MINFLVSDVDFNSHYRILLLLYVYVYEVCKACIFDVPIYLFISVNLSNL